MTSPIPLGLRVPSPPQWLDFIDRNPSQKAVGYSEGGVVLPTLVTAVNKRVNALGYRADVTDTWNAYDLDDPTFNFDSLASFDCDDATLTKRRMLAEAGASMNLLRPALCKVPPAQYGKGWSDHMVLLVLASTPVVLDNIIPWPYPFHDAPYEWLAMVGTDDAYWRLIGERWAPLTPNMEKNNGNTS